MVLRKAVSLGAVVLAQVAVQIAQMLDWTGGLRGRPSRVVVELTAVVLIVMLVVVELAVVVLLLTVVVVVAVDVNVGVVLVTDVVRLLSVDVVELVVPVMLEVVLAGLKGLRGDERRKGESTNVL